MAAGELAAVARPWLSLASCPCSQALDLSPPPAPGTSPTRWPSGARQSRQPRPRSSTGQPPGGGEILEDGGGDASPVRRGRGARWRMAPPRDRGGKGCPHLFSSTTPDDLVDGQAESAARTHRPWPSLQACRYPICRHREQERPSRILRLHALAGAIPPPSLERGAPSGRTVPRQRPDPPVTLPDGHRRWIHVTESVS